MTKPKTQKPKTQKPKTQNPKPKTQNPKPKLNTPLYIAKRYLFSKTSNSTINIITKIATVGVIIGTMALFIVLSVFSGLKSFNLFFLNTADPDIKITSVKGKSFDFTKEFNSKLKDKRIAEYSKIIEEHVLLNFDGKQKAATIKGVDPNYLNVNKMDTAIAIGEWFLPKEKNAVVIGSGISRELSLPMYSFTDNLKIYVVKPGKGQLNMNSFNSVTTQVKGIFELVKDVNHKYVFTNLTLAQELLDYKSTQVSAIELKLFDSNNHGSYAKELQKKLGTSFKVQTRKQLNEVTYKMLNIENLFTYLISTLIVIIALFNVIGAIIMMILDKRKNLKTLFNLGLTIKQIRNIFTFQGFLLTVFGMIIGLILSSIFVYIQLVFKPIMINPSLAYPVEFHLSNLFIVIATILILGIIAALIASSRISKKLIND